MPGLLLHSVDLLLFANATLEKCSSVSVSVVSAKDIVNNLIEEEYFYIIAIDMEMNLCFIIFNCKWIIRNVKQQIILKCFLEKRQFDFYIFFYIKYKNPETELW